MEVFFDKSFSKSLDKINNKIVLSKVEKSIINCENATKLSEIQNVKKLTGFNSFYRIKINDYRLGFEYTTNKITFIIICHRKDIYKLFP